MNKKQCFLELDRMLDTEQAHTDALIELLQKESKILPRDADTLLEISEQKNHLLEKLQQCQMNRASLVQSLGFDTDHQGMAMCIRSCDMHGKLKTKWNSYMEQVKICRAQNQLNGSVLDSSLRVVRQALSILYGQQLNENTYNANGHAESGKVGRSIAKA